MQDLISVIIPCFNAEKTISKALLSVLEQDYKNLEIIVVDDGSSDDSLKVINELITTDDRIIVIHQNNQGVSVARNNGLKFSTGDFIVFLDADDNYTNPFVFSKMMKEIMDNDADMCVFGFAHPCFEKYTRGDRVFNLNENKDFMDFYQDFFLFGVPWNKITKRKCLTEEFIAGIKFNEDELFNLDNLKNIKKIIFKDVVLYNYYCAPCNERENASAVNSIYSQDTFWENKNTIWHMGMKNQAYRINSIEKNFPDKIEEMKYVRSFDFFFWDFFLMAKNNVKQEHILKAIISIFQTELFKETLKFKEKYGLILKEDYFNSIEEFVTMSYKSFKNIKKSGKELSMIRIFLYFFLWCFYDLKDVIDSNDILAKSAMELKNSSSIESLYVRECLNQKP